MLAGVREIVHKIQLYSLVLLLFFSSTTLLADESKVTVGLLAELSGPSASNGKACHDGYKAAEYWFGQDRELQSRLRLIYGDHRAETRTALAEFNKLVKLENAVAVISNRGHIGMVLDPLSDRLGIPLLGIMGHADFVRHNSYGFRFWVPPELDAGTLAKLTINRGYKRAAVVVLHDDYILSLAKEFKRNFTDLSGEIVYYDSIDKDLRDFSAIVTKIKTASPDVIFLNGDVAQLGTLVRKVREQGLKQQIISNFWIAYKDVMESAGAENLEGVFWVGVDLEKKHFREALGRVSPEAKPTLVTYACFSALSSVYNVLESHPDIKGALAFAVALKKLKTVRLPDEDVPFINRELHFNLVPHHISDGKIQSGAG